MGNDRIFFRLLILLLVVTQACAPNSVPDDEQEIEPDPIVYDAYTWTEFTSPYITSNFRSIQIDAKDQVIIYTGNGVYFSEELEGAYEFISFNDEFTFGRLKMQDKFYAIASVRDSIYDANTDRNYYDRNVIITSEDLENWEIISGNYRMYSYLMDTEENRLYIGRQHGISVHDFNTGEKLYPDFLNTRLDDQITSLAKDKNGILYAATHDGAYKSTDNGETWSKAFSSLVNKDFDSVRKFITTPEYIVGLGYNGSAEFENPDYNANHFHVLNAEDNSWDHYWVEALDNYGKVVPFYASGFEIDNFDNILLSNHKGLYMKSVSGKEPLIFVGPYVDLEEYPTPLNSDGDLIGYKIEAFSNGDVIMWNGTNFWIGVYNQEFTYPE